MSYDILSRYRLRHIREHEFSVREEDLPCLHVDLTLVETMVDLEAAGATPRQLQAIRAYLDWGTYRGAARVLDVSHTAVIRLVRRLRARLCKREKAPTST